MWGSTEVSCGGMDTRLRRVDHGAEATDAEHPQVRYAITKRNKEREGRERDGMGWEEKEDSTHYVISQAQQGRKCIKIN